MRAEPPPAPRRSAARTVAAVVAAVGVVLALSAPASRAGATGSGSGGDAEGTFAVGVRTATLTDDTRPTPAVAAIGVAASERRTIPVTVWYPARGKAGADPVADAPPRRGQRFPLVVWAHGNGARGSEPPALVPTWAAHGYVVVAPDFPVSSRARSNIDAAPDWSAQPGDVAFVVDRMVRKPGVGGLRRVVDRRSVGVAGHSLGAITVLAAGFGAEPDERIDAVATFAGIPLLAGTDVASHRRPLLLVHGDGDATIPVEQSRRMFADAASPYALVTVLGGGHSDYLQAPDVETAEHLRAITVAFWDSTLKDRGDGPTAVAALGAPGRVTVAVPERRPDTPVIPSGGRR